jgi:ubiquinone/menaquinone biosynthesis C-methylase UbiE
MSEYTGAKGHMVRIYDEIAPTYGSALDLPDVFGGELVAAAHLEPGDRVLDVGCGRGACLRPACDAVGEKGFVLGIDISQKMIALLADELRRDHVANAEVCFGDADHLDVGADAFDAVLCGSVVHHFADLTPTLSTFRLMLRPGGRCATSTFPDGGPDFPWVLDALGETGLFPALAGQSGRPQAAAAPELDRSLVAAGFESVATTRVTHRFLFADTAAYMRWVRTQGLGTMVNRLDPDHLQLFVDACARRLEDHRTEDGFELTKSIDITIATRP